MAGEAHAVVQCRIVRCGNGVAYKHEVLHAALDSEPYFWPVIEFLTLFFPGVDAPYGCVFAVGAGLELYGEVMPSRFDEDLTGYIAEVLGGHAGKELVGSNIVLRSYPGFAGTHFEIKLMVVIMINPRPYAHLLSGADCRHVCAPVICSVGIIIVGGVHFCAVVRICSGGESQLSVKDGPLADGGGVLMEVCPAVGGVEVPFGGDSVGAFIVTVGAVAAWQEYGGSSHEK